MNTNITATTTFNIDSLNATEKEILQAMYNEVVACTGDEFGYMEDVSRCGLSKHQFAGYVGSLMKKGAIDYISEELSGQFALTIEAFDAAI